MWIVGLAEQRREPPIKDLRNRLRAPGKRCCHTIGIRLRTPVSLCIRARFTRLSVGLLLLPKPVPALAMPERPSLDAILVEPTKPFKRRRLHARISFKLIDQPVGAFGPQLHPEPRAGDGRVIILSRDQCRTDRREDINAVIGFGLCGIYGFRIAMIPIPVSGQVDVLLPGVVVADSGVIAPGIPR